MTSLIVIAKRIKYLLTYRYKFMKRHGYKLHDKSPVTWNDKIMYRKKNADFYLLSTFSDKILVKDYVGKKIGSKYLVSNLAVFDDVNQINFDDLPRSFVIKSNHGSGPGHIEIVHDKDKCDILKIKEKFQKAINEDYGYISGEKFYSLINPRIFIEEYIVTDGYTPDDYKLHCFNNSQGFKVFIQVDSGRYINHKRSIFDSNWSPLGFKLNTDYELIDDCPKPQNLNEMIDISKKLSEGFKYLRVDLYNVEGEILFGEMTFTHGNGNENFHPVSVDYEWGVLWE